jgi:hypothetical protein
VAQPQRRLRVAHRHQRAHRRRVQREAEVDVVAAVEVLLQRQPPQPVRFLGFPTASQI